MQRLGLDYYSSLVYVFFFSLALGSPEDLYIKKLVAEEVTSTNQTDIVNFFTENVIYRIGTELTFNGLDALRSAFTNTSQIIPQNAITTQSIDLLPPFDEQGAASTGTGVVYFTTTTPGQGGFAGQALILFVKFEEKYV